MKRIFDLLFYLVALAFAFGLGAVKGAELGEYRLLRDLGSEAVCAPPPDAGGGR